MANPNPNPCSPRFGGQSIIRNPVIMANLPQKFGGYSFCHLGRDKGRKAKKQKRKARIGENESAQIAKGYFGSGTEVWGLFFLSPGQR